MDADPFVIVTNERHSIYVAEREGFNNFVVRCRFNGDDLELAQRTCNALNNEALAMMKEG